MMGAAIPFSAMARAIVVGNQRGSYGSTLTARTMELESIIRQSRGCCQGFSGDGSGQSHSSCGASPVNP